MTRVLKVITFSFLIFAAINSAGQFYNGHQMFFGKNRVQFDDFDWFFMRYKKFDTYFYSGGKELAVKTSEYAYKEIEKIENRLDRSINNRLIFVIYHNLSDFRQSNIGLKTLNNQYNIGGNTRIIDNIVFLYVEGENKKLRNQIRSSVAKITVNNILYGNDWKNKLANSTLMNFPDWYYKGLISYLSKDWDEKVNNKVKNGILNGNYDKINRLTGQDAVYAGHSIWYYISNTYGEQIIPTVLYMTRVSKNIENGFLYVLGTNLKMLSFNWKNYFKQFYQTSEVSGKKPKGTEELKRSRNDRVYQEAKIRPDGKYLAYTTNIMGKMKIFIKNRNTKKHNKIYKQGHKLDQITDYSYPILQWHPSGKLLGYIVEKKGGIYYYTYNIETEETQERIIRGFDKILHFSYSDDGLKMVFSGYKNGRSDIFIYNIAANTYQNLTADDADDYHPVFIKNSEKILFQSKRAVDSVEDKENRKIPRQENKDVFIYDISNFEDPLTRLTNTPATNEKQSYFAGDNLYYYLANKTGIYNRYAASYDSTISYIDTITHYRYFMNAEPVTNYQMNILEHDISEKSEEYAEIYYNKDDYSILTDTLREKATDPDTSRFREVYLKRFRQKQKKDRDTAVKKESEKDKDSLINIDAYTFESEILEEAKKDNDFDKEGNLKEKPVNKYLTTFYTSRIINQIDFGFLNSSYQKFTGGPFYFNPGFNILLNVKAMDLFEDYRITGGFRFAGNFDSNEYLFSFENLESRLNKQFMYHRQTMSNYTGNDLYKTYLNEVMNILRYPFNQVSAVQSTVTLRQDKVAYQTTDYQNLLKDNEHDYWASIKLEYIFDNTRNLMVNINEGMRFKAFGEFYKQIDNEKTDLFVFGCDFRHYQPIHRNLIIANRFAASSSFGNSKLIYYLGGIDNWINISNNTPMFDQSTRIDPEEDYAYQAVATNMRGFPQNVRNGNNFALINSEIRWPIVRYLFNRPLNSDFLNSFQVIGFFDVGTAWSGSNPFNAKNAYVNDIYNYGNVTVTIDNNNYPIVAGYGVGVRTRLLGYFVRLDYARGIEDNTLLPGMFYLSLNLDF